MTDLRRLPSAEVLDVSTIENLRVKDASRSL